VQENKPLVPKECEGCKMVCPHWCENVIVNGCLAPQYVEPEGSYQGERSGEVFEQYDRHNEAIKEYLRLKDEVFERERQEKRQSDRILLLEILRQKTLDVQEAESVHMLMEPPVVVEWDQVEKGGGDSVYSPLEEPNGEGLLYTKCCAVGTLGINRGEIQTVVQQVNIMRKRFRANASRSFVCVKCEVVLIGGLNADECQLKLTGICRKCDPRRKCLKCTELVLCIDHFKQSEIKEYHRDNYLKFQRKNLSNCPIGPKQEFSGKEYYSRPYETKFDYDSILLDGVNKLAKLKAKHSICALDFECIDGDPSRVVEAGVVWYNGCCDTLKIENYRVHGYVGVGVHSNPVYCHSIYMTREEMIYRLKTLVARFDYLVVFDSRLEAAAFDCMKLEKKFIDVQVLFNPDRRRQLRSFVSQLSSVQDSLHCAANDAYWIFILTARYRMKTDYRLFERSKMEKYLSTSCLVGDYENHYGRNGLCLSGSHVDVLVCVDPNIDSELVTLDSLGYLKVGQGADVHVACDFI